MKIDQGKNGKSKVTIEITIRAMSAFSSLTPAPFLGHKEGQESGDTEEEVEGGEEERKTAHH